MKTKILIVDDSALARRTLRQLLEGMGYLVEEAPDGAQALERYYLNPPEVVVLDMVMNGMYGLEVLTKVREMNPKARVIVATADIQKSTADQARAAGALALLTKPINRLDLEKALECVLNGGSAWN